MNDLVRLRMYRSADRRIFQALVGELLAEEQDRLVNSQVSEYQRGRVKALKDLRDLLEGKRIEGA